MADRYSDEFRNTLLTSHTMSVRGELWFGTPPAAPTFVAELPIVGGNVTADRAANVRRTASIDLAPTVLTDPVIAPKLKPYGAVVKLWRGIRYGDGRVLEFSVFSGRIDAVEDSLVSVSVTCSDGAAVIVDSQFTQAVSIADFGAIGVLTVANFVKALITGVMPAGATFTIDPGVDTTTIAASGTSLDGSRADALDSLCTQIGAEWMADPDGNFHLAPLPSLITSTSPVAWIIDAGDQGVLLSRQRRLERQNVFNHAIVDGEAIGGSVGAHEEYKLTQADDPELYWGGPYGKIARTFGGQQARTTKAALDLARTLAMEAKSAVNGVDVECIPNPQLRLGDVVRVFDGRGLIDGMYYVQQFNLPLAPDSSMTMNVFQSLRVVAGTGGIAPDRRRLPEGTHWTPTWPQREVT